ncbi:HEAT repeat domain-containing protein [Methanobrevibacter sp.]|uniref:HEAT repeat domain-containing protein n=1 Tax=Methanobrevibacter sp. TaxID=66852 RepID=UPI002579E870|nr:HEAT repeat domain-containing protein [Methanobrevibacter sp.]MBR2665644.1 HEAT repeat domain-containing protein [Methanobrevibacter sp.]MBR3197373.1 HEAT repeat domain-containing protein [Methanobrevibacter sp.]
MSDLSFEEAINNLSDDDVKVRKEAIESLVGITDEEAIEPLIKATTDESAQVRFKAAEILGNMGDVAVDKLIEEFENAEGKDKRFLAFALKETGDKKVIPYFVEATNDEDFGVRKVAVRSLGELQAEEELDAIAKCLEDEDWGVRLAAIQALGDIATDDSIKLIKDARKAESDKDFKKSCNKAIKKAQKRQKAKASGEEVVSLIPMSTLKEMEKTNVQKAIKGYEGYVESRQAKDAPYKRLCILYRKANDYDSEVRVLKTACEVFADNDKKLSYFQKRLDKLQ